MVMIMSEQQIILSVAFTEFIIAYGSYIASRQLLKVLSKYLISMAEPGTVPKLLWLWAPPPVPSWRKYPINLTSGWVSATLRSWVLRIGPSP